MQEEELLILEILMYTSLYKEKYKEGQVSIVLFFSCRSSFFISIGNIAEKFVLTMDLYSRVPLRQINVFSLKGNIQI